MACKWFPPEAVGYKEQKYAVICDDGDGREMTVGYTNDPEGSQFIRMVELHPSWHTPRVITVEQEEVRRSGL